MRDGRGNPGRYVPKQHQAKLRLADLLRRRRTTLKAFMDELGLTTHSGLCLYCARLGVQPPSSEEFYAVFPAVPQANSAAEGVVVLSPPADEAVPGTAAPEPPTAASQKKPRRKKDVAPIE
jgi:hypothetical protein